jgi:hypothetical protein
MRYIKNLLFYILFPVSVSFGQTADSSLIAKETMEYPVSLYKEATSLSQNLYNGRLYFPYDSRQEEHQFFETRKWNKGVVFYDGQQFDSISMMYDIVRDELIIKHFYGDYMLLQSHKVSYFSYLNHNYQRLVSGIDIEPGMRTGFYDLIYNGKTRAVVRRTKQRQEKIQDKRVITLFPQKNFYYILKDGHYHSVHSKKSVFSLFPENQKILKKSLRDKKIKFRQDREGSIASIVALYDQLAEK